MHLPSIFTFFILFNCDLSAKFYGLRAVPSLKFLFVVAKHGARAPTHTYPKDLYKDRSNWPDRPGLITQVGKQQMYRVGKKIRFLYNGYMSELYENSKVMIQSTLVDRTMISASTLLAGLYPPQDYQRWHPNITWQPVPIYPNLLDKALLTLDPRHCPRYLKEQNESISLLDEQNKQYADIYKVISDGSGRNLTTCSQMYLLFNNFLAVRENGLLLPNWGEAIFKSRLWPVVSRLVRDTTMKNVKMIKILNGLFLEKILDLFKWRLNLKKEKEQEDLSLFLHVGHDITIMCLLAAMGFSEIEIPWSSTTLLFELHTNFALESKHEVQVLKIDGRKNSSKIPQKLELPACTSPCDLSTFIAQTQKYTTKDWNKECADMTSSSD